MDYEKYRALPEATPEMILLRAEDIAECLHRPLEIARIHEAANSMADTHQFSDYEVQQAGHLLRTKLNPQGILFKNERTQFFSDHGYDAGADVGDFAGWKAIKQIGKGTTLADFRDFINSMVGKYGEKSTFYIDSDRGDEYFILRKAKAAVSD